MYKDKEISHTHLNTIFFIHLPNSKISYLYSTNNLLDTKQLSSLWLDSCNRWAVEQYYSTLFKYNTMIKGKVKFFNETKGFGFIQEEDTNTEHFVHVSGLIDEIREDDTVEFELKEGKKGLNAINVTVV